MVSRYIKGKKIIFKTINDPTDNIQIHGTEIEKVTN